jgi:hypothetical protein
VAGAGGFELTNVVAEYPFEVSHEFQSFQRNLGTILFAREPEATAIHRRDGLGVTVW